jgi:hypothetical protein
MLDAPRCLGASLNLEHLTHLKDLEDLDYLALHGVLMMSAGSASGFGTNFCVRPY